MSPFSFRFINMATNRGCKNNPDAFCYICGEFTKVSNRKEIDYLVDKLYHTYFGMKLGDQEQSWNPHIRLFYFKKHVFQGRLKVP